MVEPQNQYHEAASDASGRPIPVGKLDGDLMSPQDDDPRVSLSVKVDEGSSPGPIELKHAPFNLLVVGDFSGRDVGGSGSDKPLGERAPFPLTSVDDTLGRIRPSISVVRVYDE